MSLEMVLEPDFLYMLAPINQGSFLNNEVAKSVAKRELFQKVRNGEIFGELQKNPRKQ